MKTVKYQITMEVEIEVDNPNDKVTNNWTTHNLGIIAEAGFRGKKDVLVGKVKVERIGVTKVKPKVEASFHILASRKQRHKITEGD